MGRITSQPTAAEAATPGAVPGFETPGAVSEAETPGASPQTRTPYSVPEAETPDAVPEAKTLGAVLEDETPVAVPEAKTPGALPEAEALGVLPEAEAPVSVPEAEMSDAVPEMSDAVPEEETRGAVLEDEPGGALSVTEAAPEAGVPGAGLVAEASDAVPEAEAPRAVQKADPVETDISAAGAEASAAKVVKGYKAATKAQAQASQTMEIAVANATTALKTAVKDAMQAPATTAVPDRVALAVKLLESKPTSLVKTYDTMDGSIEEELVESLHRMLAATELDIKAAQGDVAKRYNRPGYVYIFYDQDERFKVGSSCNPERRLKQLRTGNPDLGYLEKFHVSKRIDAEKACHEKLANSLYPAEGVQEWFHKLSKQEVIDIVKECCKQWSLSDEEVDP